MAMSSGGGTGVRSEINITPLVDVVLVLLIIFMVVTPLLQMGYSVTTPPKVESVVVTPPSDQIIVRMDKGGQVFINKTLVTQADYIVRLRELTKQGKSNKMVFFAADGDLLYDKVATFLDLTHEAGVNNIGIVFDDLNPTAPAAAAGAGPT